MLTSVSEENLVAVFPDDFQDSYYVCRPLPRGLINMLVEWSPAFIQIFRNVALEAFGVHADFQIIINYGCTPSHGTPKLYCKWPPASAAISIFYFILHFSGLQSFPFRPSNGVSRPGRMSITAARLFFCRVRRPLLNNYGKEVHFIWSRKSKLQSVLMKRLKRKAEGGT